MSYSTNVVKVSKTNPVIRKILQATFPDYNGRKISLREHNRPIDVRSYWEGGSRSFFVFFNLATGQVMPIPEQSAFNRPLQGASSYPIPAGVCCVEHCLFCGKDLGIRIYVDTRETPFEQVGDTKIAGLIGQEGV